MNQDIPTFAVTPIGYVRACEQEGRFEIEILAQFRDALEKLEQFSHAVIIWWADQHDIAEERAILTTELPYARGIRAGVFACRSEYRPNPIAITIMPILMLDKRNGILRLPWIDAYDGTPVLDIKPYTPVSDRIRDFRVADWMQDWPEWMEEAGAFFAAHPTDFGD